MSGLCDWRSDAFTFQENEAFCNEVTELALAERPLRMFFQAGQLLCELALAEWLLVASRIAVGSSSLPSAATGSLGRGSIFRSLAIAASICDPMACCST